MKASSNSAAESNPFTKHWFDAQAAHGHGGMGKSHALKRATAADQEIDALVYDLYVLAEKEIKLVDEAND